MTICRIRFSMKVLVCFTLFVCVMARTEINIAGKTFFKKLPFSENLLNRTALSLCDMIGDMPDDPVCIKNFMSAPKDVGVPSALKIRCQKETELTYEISPSKTLQLVVMEPHDEDAEVTTYILYAGSTIGTGSYKPEYNYTLWTTAIDPTGTHSIWLKGPQLHALEHIEPRNYSIQVDQHVNTSVSDPDQIPGVEVVLTWNSFDASDVCFEVINLCQKTKFFNGNIKPDGVRKVTLEIPTNDVCSFSLQGKYGTTTIEYTVSIPSEPEPVSNITVHAEQSLHGDESWDVTVSWTPPANIPEWYNVTLEAETTTMINVSRNATEVTFHKVRGRGYYDVSVNTVVGGWMAHEYKAALFPEMVKRSSGMVTALSAVLASLLVCAALLAGVVWCRRRRAKRYPPHYYPEYLQKNPKGSIDMQPDAVTSEDSWEVRPERLLLHEVIGEGAFGVVRRGTLAPGRKVAVKMLKDYPSLDEIRSFLAEMELMKSVGAHPHVVSLVGCCSRRKPFIVAEYCSRGDLLSYLRCSWDVMVSKRNAKYYNNNTQTSNYRNDLFKNKSQEQSKLVVNKLYELEGICDVDLTFVDLLSFCRQIAMGMEFLASNRVVHRDLAARNVLVTSDRTLKIADFGLSRDVYQENQYTQKGNGKLPVKWMALESLTHRIYTTQSDVWSFGVVIWEVVTVGGSPYPGVPPARIPRLLRSGYRMPKPGACSKQLYEVMLSCWRARPRERPTFTELHTELDALLHCACAEQYLVLDLDSALDEDLKPEEPRASRYSRIMEFARGKRRRERESSLPSAVRTHSNHYSSPPASLAPLTAPAHPMPLLT